MLSIALTCCVVAGCLGIGTCLALASDKAGQIEGRVQTSDGASLPEATVTLEVVSGTGDGVQLVRRVITGPDGKFSFLGLGTGKYKVRAEATGLQSASKEVDITAADSRFSIELTLDILPLNQTVVASETGSAQQLDDLPAHVTVLSATDVAESSAITLDDFLRRVPSFSLFRRSSSLVAQPTTQGVSLRGIGASGVSRTLVMLDGVPFNDPVGSWVYWSRIPRNQIEEIEVDEGGISSRFGSSAMAGVIDVTTRRPSGPILDADGFVGTRGTSEMDLFAGDKRGPFAYNVGGSVFRTAGYILIPESLRGPVDVNASSQYETMNGRAEYQVARDTRVYFSGRFFNEVRDNGTRVQTNATREGQLQAGVRSHTGDGSDWQANFFSYDQTFRAGFSSIAPGRLSESLTLLQHEPSYGYGGNAQWSKVLRGKQLLSIGGDGRWIYARDLENVFVQGVNTRNRRIPGTQALSGVFLQDFWTPTWRVNFIFGGRVDHWKNYNASQTQVVVSTNAVATTVYPDVSKTTATGRVGMVFRPTRSVSVRAAFYQGFRAPTLDELYRSFRVGNVVTNANPNLGPERVNGFEFGLNQQVTRRIFWRTTFFADRLDSPISNVTISSTPSLITQQRQNLGYVNVKGLELNIDYRLEQHWKFCASYLFNQSIVGSYPATGSIPANQIIGNLLAQIPKHRSTAQVRYTNPKWINAGVEGRYESHRFDDSRNTLKLGSYFVASLEASRALGDRWGIFVNLENAFDRQYYVLATPTPQTGTPILFTGGVRFHWSKDRRE
jgi:iron complex outermembrane recepter protein